jgi:anti-sigma factor RsiW
MVAGWSGPVPRRLLGGHLGSSVSALVDGQLDDEANDRAWQHVHQCEPCRRLVEHESWLKRRLAHIADTPRVDEPSDRFLGALLHLDPEAMAWAETHQVEDRGRSRRRAGIVVVGAGSVSAAVLGIATLGGAPLGVGQGDRTPATTIGGSTAGATPTRAVVAPTAEARGRLPGFSVTPGPEGLRQARAVGHRP